jgi:hypothetical protein
LFNFFVSHISDKSANEVSLQEGRLKDIQIQKQKQKKAKS